jgi:integrase
MYTGMRLGEILHMKVTEVGSDRFTVSDSKTYSGLRDIPIHNDIQQLVERLIQTSEDGFLISGESANNKYKVRTKGISHRFSRLKADLGFRTKKEVFHSLRGTLANRFENAGVNETFAARIIGHQIETMTYGVYSGQIDWDKAVEAMSQIQYLQPTKKDPEGS